MATKKTKKVSKKTASKKAPAKRTRAAKKGPRMKMAPYVANEERIERFMHSLIGYGYLGDEIAEDGKGRKAQAADLRRMGEVLDRQMRKYGEKVEA